ncbi:MAG TPA: hypothetical protein VKG86_10795 [Terracidiphilus sp.]|nr:hypothetical protein [Terracidiphilus sp.]
MKLAKTSIALLVIQLAIVSSIAAKYLYQRWTCPRVWTRTVAYDPELVMRGRYLSVQLIVDGCQSTLPSALHAIFPRNIDGTTRPSGFSVTRESSVQFRAKLKVEGNKLEAIRIPEADLTSKGVNVSALPGSSCDALRIVEPVDFYIAEHAVDPTPLKPGQELWIEVTVPPTGPPRPIQLALKQDGAWKPLAFQ